MLIPTTTTLCLEFGKAAGRARQTAQFGDPKQWAGGGLASAEQRVGLNVRPIDCVRETVCTIRQK